MRFARMVFVTATDDATVIVFCTARCIESTAVETTAIVIALVLSIVAVTVLVAERVRFTRIVSVATTADEAVMGF